MREWALRMALTLAGVALALGLVEVVLRWVVPDRFVYRTPRFTVTSVHPLDRGAVMSEPLFGALLRYVDAPWQYGLKRDLRARLVSSEFDVAVRTNSLGLRGGPIWPQKRGPRILGLGDSFAMGYGVEEGQTYLSQLASGWPGGTAEAIDAGVVGYSPGNSFEYLIRDGFGLEPDLVVFQLWTIDDLCAGASVARPAARGPVVASRRLRELARSSHLAMFARDRVRAIAGARRMMFARGWLVPFPATRLLDRGFSQRCGAALDALGAMLSEADAACRAHGARLVVLVLPAREQVYREDWARAVAYNLAEPDSALVDFDAPDEAFATVAAARGLEVVDLLEPFRAQRQPERLYFAGYDPHLTAAGHRRVAEALLAHLSREDP